MREHLHQHLRQHLRQYLCHYLFRGHLPRDVPARHLCDNVHGNLPIHVLQYLLASNLRRHLYYLMQLYLLHDTYHAADFQRSDRGGPRHSLLDDSVGDRQLLLPSGSLQQSQW